MKWLTFNPILVKNIVYKLFKLLLKKSDTCLEKWAKTIPRGKTAVLPKYSEGGGGNQPILGNVV